MGRKVVQDKRSLHLLETITLAGTDSAR